MHALRPTHVLIVLALALLAVSGCASRGGTYQIDEGSFAVELPEGWHVEAYDEEAQYLQAEGSSSDQYLTVSVGRGSVNPLIFAMGTFGGASLDELADNAQQSAAINFGLSESTFLGVEVSEVETSAVGEREVRRFTFNSQRRDTNALYRGTVYIFPVGSTSAGDPVFAVVSSS